MSEALESLDIQAARDLARKRQDLERAVAQRAEDLAGHQRHIATPTAHFQNPTESTEKLFADTQRVLREKREALVEARRELDQFNEQFPTKEALAKKAHDLEVAAERARQKELRDRFLKNTRLRLQALTELDTLEVEAIQLVTEANSKWPSHSASGPMGPYAIHYSDGLLALAGVDGKLVPILDAPNLWEFQKQRSLGRFNSEIRPQIERYLKRFESE